MDLPLLEQRILQTIASKPTNSTGFNDVEIEGCSIDLIDAAVESLHQKGLINAYFDGGGLGGTSKWSVASLTELGAEAIRTP